MDRQLQPALGSTAPVAAVPATLAAAPAAAVPATLSAAPAAAVPAARPAAPAAAVSDAPAVAVALPTVTIAAIVAIAALLAQVGSDARWLAALGHVIVTRHSIPSGIPFAAAPTGHWPNPLVLAELIFDALEGALGDRGLMLAQLVAVAGALAIVARDARAGGARPGGMAAALVLAAIGSISSLAIVRVQLFSLLLFPALAALLRSQARAPSRRIWLAVPLLALWSNLHGAALLGLAVLLGYLLVQRARREPLRALAVGAAATAALCLTPALWHTPAYYAGVLTNVAAQRGVGMWGPLSPASPFDLLLIVAALVVLAAICARRLRPAAWEIAVLAGLALLTLRADRDGVWLMLFAAPIAARALGARANAPAAADARRRPARARGDFPEKRRALGFGRFCALSGKKTANPRRRFGFSGKSTFAGGAGVAAGAAVAAAVAAVAAVAVVRGPVPSGASPALLRDAVTLAHGSPVLANGSIDEQVALAGGRIWAGDPIDAFPRPVQAAYLDWLAGNRAGARAATRAVRVALVTRGSATQALMARLPSFTAVRTEADAVLYERTGTGR